MKEKPNKKESIFSELSLPRDDNLRESVLTRAYLVIRVCLSVTICFKYQKTIRQNTTQEK